jgi:hypothetical protein
MSSVTISSRQFTTDTSNRKERARPGPSTTAGTWAAITRKVSKAQQAPSPRHCLRDRRAYWGATMRQMGLVCAFVLPVISGGFHMDLDPDSGPAPPTFLSNHLSALAEGRRRHL